jgi:hypothetical protein
MQGNYREQEVSEVEPVVATARDEPTRQPDLKRWLAIALGGLAGAIAGIVAFWS